MNRLQMRIAAGASFLVTAVPGGWLTLRVLAIEFPGSHGVHPRPFDAELWNDPDWRDSDGIPANFHSIRQRMVDDLLATKLVPGVTEAEVLEWIGQPDNARERNRDDNTVWQYRLGLDEFGMNVVWLNVLRDESGCVLEAKCVHRSQ